MQTRFIQIRNILLAILLLNWAVAIAKIIYALFTSCLSMTADGFHSLSDGASNIIGLLGIYIASRPTDKSHPYGHKKYETYFSIAIAGILFIISFNLLKEVAKRFANPTAPIVTGYSFAVMLTTMAVNIFVMSYEYRKGRQLKSDILISDSMHTKSDIFSSASVIIALFAARWGLHAIDLIAGVFISILIASTGAQIVRNSSSVLCDGLAIDTQHIRDIVKRIPAVKQCHKIRTRGRPDDIHVDLHISLDTDMHVDKAHHISHIVQAKIKEEVLGVTDVIVHVEPGE